MTKTQIIQDALNLEADDVWGPKTDAAVAAEKEASLRRQGQTSNVQRPTSNGGNTEGEHPRWPREADAPQFYGRSDGSSAWEAEHLVAFDAPYALYMDGQLVRRIRCHKLVKDSLLRILNKIRDLYKTPEAIHAVGLDQYDGCYNFRNVRGASHLSMHSYGAAIDFDAEHNPLGATHGRMPPEVVAIFKAEGWRWGGDYTGRKDWMHFEACS